MEAVVGPQPVASQLPDAPGPLGRQAALPLHVLPCHAKPNIGPYPGFPGRPGHSGHMEIHVAKGGDAVGEHLANPQERAIVKMALLHLGLKGKNPLPQPAVQGKPLPVPPHQHHGHVAVHIHKPRQRQQVPAVYLPPVVLFRRHCSNIFHLVLLYAQKTVFPQHKILVHIPNIAKKHIHPPSLSGSQKADETAPESWPVAQSWGVLPLSGLSQGFPFHPGGASYFARPSGKG